jgi:hypothetical protein
MAGLAFTLAVAGGGALAQQLAPLPAVPVDPSTVLAQVPVVHPVIVVRPSINVHPHVMFMSVGQVKDDLLAGTEKFAQGASKVTEINLDPSSMGMMDEHGTDADMARKMDLMVVHTYTYDKPGMYRMEDLDAYRKKLQDGSWHCSVHVRENEKSTDICSRPGADHETNEMVIITANPQKLTFIHMKGKVPLNELGNMGEGGGRNMRSPRPPNPPKSPTAPSAPSAAVPPTPPTSPM